MFEAIPVNFNRNRPLQQVDRDHKAAGILEHRHDAFGACKRAMLDLDTLADLKVRPRLAIGVRLQYRADIIQFPLFDRHDCFAQPDDCVDAWRYQDRQTMDWIEPAENVAWKERQFDLFCSI